MCFFLNKNRMKSLLVFLFVGLSFVSKATDHFATSASEANEMLKTAKPNDRIILKDGVYKNAVIKFINSSITFTAEHAGKVFFEENSTLSFAGEQNTIEGFVWQNGGKGLDTKAVIELRIGKEVANYCSIKNCSIDGYNTSDLNTDNKWVSLYGTYNTFTHCLLKDKFNFKKFCFVLLSIYGVSILSFKSLIPNVNLYELGELYAVISVFFWGFWSVGRQKLSDYLNNSEISVLVMFIAGISTFIFSVIKGESLNMSAFSIPIVLVGLLIGVFLNIFATFLEN